MSPPRASLDLPPEMAIAIDRGAGFIPLSETLTSSVNLNELATRLLPILRLEHPDIALFKRSGRSAAGTYTAVQTILAYDAFETFVSSRGAHVVCNDQETIVLRGNPFLALANRIEKYQVKTPDAPVCGALGYFAYDAVRYLEPRLQKAPGNLKETLTAPQDKDADFKFFRNFVVINHSSATVQVVAGFVPRVGDNSQAYTKARANLAAQVEILKELLAKPSHSAAALEKARGEPEGEVAFSSFSAACGPEQFTTRVKKIKSLIRDGEIFQAVISEKLTKPFAGDPLELFTELERTSPSPYEFYFASGDSTFIGASPEMLLKVDGRTLESHPIAGTRPRGIDRVSDERFEKQLRASRKENAEHLMLVDLARNDLGRVAEINSVHVESFCKVERFSAVMHLVSRVKARLRPEITALQALAASFPAGTLSGAPKLRAMEIISEAETERRGFYGGALVLASYNGDLDSCIAIRSAQIRSAVVTLQAGAGILADSNAHREYQEIHQKTRALRRALASVREAEIPALAVGPKNSGVSA